MPVTGRHPGDRKGPFGQPERHQGGRKDSLRRTREAGKDPSDCDHLDSLRGTREPGKGSLDSLRGTREARKDPLDSLQGTREAGKGSLDSLRGAREAGKDQFNSLRGTREAGKNHLDSLGGTREAGSRACATRAKAQRPERRVLGIRVIVYMASALPGMVPPQGWCQARGCLPGKPPPPLAGGCRLGPHGARPGRALLFRVLGFRV